MSYRLPSLRAGFEFCDGCDQVVDTWVGSVSHANRCPDRGLFEEETCPQCWVEWTPEPADPVDSNLCPVCYYKKEFGDG